MSSRNLGSNLPCLYAIERHSREPGYEVQYFIGELTWVELE